MLTDGKEFPFSQNSPEPSEVDTVVTDEETDAGGRGRSDSTGRDARSSFAVRAWSEPFHPFTSLDLTNLLTST